MGRLSTGDLRHFGQAGYLIVPDVVPEELLRTADDEIDELVSIIRLVSDAGVSVILVEHHADLVMSLCHAITVLDAGEVIAAGPPAENIRPDCDTF